MKSTYTAPTMTHSGLVVSETLSGSNRTLFENSGIQYVKAPGAAVGFYL
jgi:hypothetical protein